MVQKSRDVPLRMQLIVAAGLALAVFAALLAVGGWVSHRLFDSSDTRSHVLTFAAQFQGVESYEVRESSNGSLMMVDVHLGEGATAEQVAHNRNMEPQADLDGGRSSWKLCVFDSDGEKVIGWGNLRDCDSDDNYKVHHWYSRHEFIELYG